MLRRIWWCAELATRRERVVLTLEDNFTTQMARAAAAAGALDVALDRLDGSGSSARDSMRGVRTESDEVSRTMRRSSADIDRYSGRLRLLAETAAVLGPGLIPIGAIGIPAVTGLAQQLGFAALAGGTVIGAFQGMGKALEAVNKAALEPTAENIEAARIAMEDLSPAAQDFAMKLRDTVPALKELRDTAAEGMFPGLSEGIDGIEQALPRIQRIVESVSTALGGIAGDAGASLGGERWTEFFDYLATDAPSALRDMAEATGNVAHAMSELWMAFDPLNDDFSKWLVDATAGLDEWAQGLSQTDGFEDFIDYVRTNGPIVADSMAALGRALLDIVEAAAPLGGPVLKGIEAVSKAISAIADSDLGTPIMAGVAALSLYNRTMAVTAAASRGMQGGLMGGFFDTRKSNTRAAIDGIKRDVGQIGAIWGTAGARTERESFRMSKATESLRTNIGSLTKEAGRVAGPVAALGVISTGAADGIGLTNTATLGLLGSMAGVPGAVGGAAVGAILDMKAAADQSAEALARMNAALGSGNAESLASGIEAGTHELERQKSLMGNLDFKLFSFGDDIDEIQQVEHKLQQLRIEADKLDGTGVSQLTTNMRDLLRDALAPSEAAARAAARGYELTGQGAREAAGDVAAFSRAMIRANNALGREASLDGYLGSLDTMREQLADIGPGLSKFTAVGRQNRGALRDMASAALEYGNQIQDLDKRGNFLDRSRDDFIAVARAAGATRQQAMGLADAFGLVDRIKARPEVELKGKAKERAQEIQAEIKKIKDKMVRLDEKGAAAARVRIQQLRQEIANLQDKSVTITTNRNVVYRTIGSPAGQTGVGAFTTRRRADGGQVWAMGSESRGERADSIPAMLSHREYVQPVAAVDWYGEKLMEDIRTLRFPRPEGYADGGMVGYAAGGRVRHALVTDSGVKDSSPVARLRRFREALEKSTKTLEKERSRRESLISSRDTYASTVRDSFRSDPFARPDNIWAAGAGDPLAVLRSDISNASAFSKQIATLKKYGVKNGALAEIDSADEAASIIALGSSGAKEYQALFDRRQSITGSVGSAAGQAAFGSAIAAQTAIARRQAVETRRQTAAINRMEKRIARQGREIGKAVNGGAAAARRRKRGGGK